MMKDGAFDDENTCGFCIIIEDNLLLYRPIL
jgi:hypothetical protein